MDTFASVDLGQACGEDELEVMQHFFDERVPNAA